MRSDDFEAPVFSGHGGVENVAEAGKDHEGVLLQDKGDGIASARSCKYLSAHG